jgi:(p)ppGpp synthase/HD superfamily hydrolase
MKLLTHRFEEALVFTHRLHIHQLRKGSQVPYISHLLSVAGLVLESGGDEDEAIAALLHDAVEDQGGRKTLELISQRFGQRVADIVEACSDSFTLVKPPWKQRKEAYLAHLRNADPSVRLVSLADKVHNVRSILFSYQQIGDELWRRFKGGKEGTLWYYQSLAQIFQEQNNNPLVIELLRLVQELEKITSE